MPGPDRPDLPDRNASRALADWLAGPRGRLLRRAQIGLRKRVLDLGCGHGIVTDELARRSAGEVVALDRLIDPARRLGAPDIRLVGADARALPFAGGAFDLAFCQNVLLWVGDMQRVVGEVARVLQPGGALVAIEPDYGGMVEHPPQIALRDVWLSALERAGADPTVGCRLPGLCEAAGLDVWVELQGLPQPASVQATRLLYALPLTEDERCRVSDAERLIAARQGVWSVFVHVPYFLVVATKA